MTKTPAGLSKFYAVLLILLGGVIGFLIRTQFDKLHESFSMRGKLVREGGYEFINPLLSCDIAGPELQFGELDDFRSRVEELIQREKGDNRAAVYFRDLNSGSWFGINEKDRFSPGSLMKLPAVVAYFKAAEKDPSLLQKRLTYDGSADENRRQHFRPSRNLEAGRSYTVEDLIERTLIHSDNNALLLLASNIGEAELWKTYVKLGLIVPGMKSAGVGDHPISLEDYTTLFRILYDASYLNRENSERLLRLLSLTEFKKGLAAGIPDGIKAAHKFGERTLDPEEREKELHDCGIVYYPGKPYLLCIMTDGSDFQSLAGLIEQISSLVYQGVNNL